MDEKKLEKEKKQFKDEIQKYRTELQGRDRATYSEAKTWKYDHKTGNLVNHKEK